MVLGNEEMMCCWVSIGFFLLMVVFCFEFGMVFGFLGVVGRLVDYVVYGRMSRWMEGRL